MTAYWDRVFEPAIRLAEEGFTVSPRLNGRLGKETALQQDPRAKVYFYQEDGSPKPVGFLLKSPDFAKTLGVLAERGADAFYNGPIAEDIVATVRGHPTNPGDLTLADLRGYAVAERSPVCGKYRVYAICGMGPPSSGTVAVLQILSVLEARDMSRAAPGPEAVHWFAEAGRLAFADRALYLGDPGFVNVPVQGLTDPGYLKSRAALVSPDKSMGRAQPGDPPFQKSQRLAPVDGIENGTSHIAVVDAQGNAVAMTTTIEDGFGARLMTRSGFLLNKRAHRLQLLAARRRKMDVVVIPLRSAEDIAPAFAIVDAQSPDALLIDADPITITQRHALIDECRVRNLPAVHTYALEVRDGGLISYGPSSLENFAGAAEYADRILRGAKVAELPFEEPTHFTLAVNLRSARSLGLIIPPTLLARADEVIE